MDALRSALDPALSPPAVDDLAAWWAATAATRDAWTAPVDRALIGGACADRLGFAFAAAYAEALRALVPDLPAGSIGALCATEDTGNHPRAIRTRLEPAGERYQLTGRKKWASLAPAASSLLIVATTGDGPDGKPQLRVARIATTAPGVRLLPSTASFVPEIPHAEVELTAAAVTDVLPGDGYDAYLKPFRTIEDLHLHVALAGYLLSVIRRKRFPAALSQRVLAHTVTARALAAAPPLAATTHLALAGLLDLAAETIAALEALWATSPDDEFARWQRDRRLLQVASTARTARTARAWSELG
jgi:alkylation response protein AidB-like acyl-CoA dehydrogenase